MKYHVWIQDCIVSYDYDTAWSGTVDELAAILANHPKIGDCIEVMQIEPIP